MKVISESILADILPFVLIVAALMAGLDSCSKSSPTAASVSNTPDTISTVALTYLDSALDIMQEFSVKRFQINWTDFRRKVLSAAAGAQSVPATYAAISYAVELLGDNHSFFRPPGQNTSYYRPAELSQGGRIGDSIGYVSVPSFVPTDSLSGVKFATRIQSIIKQVDSPDLKGWIVDLRNNIGGDMYPMIAGIGPVLGEGVCGYFFFPVSPDSNVWIPWSYVDGASYFSKVKLAAVSGVPYNLKETLPPVAVLIGSGTISAGEATAISFEGRKRTMFFGQPSAGMTTGNSTFVLSDSAILVLATALEADRTRRVYNGAISPNFFASAAGDSTIDAAIRLINRQ